MGMRALVGMTQGLRVLPTCQAPDELSLGC